MIQRKPVMGMIRCPFWGRMIPMKNCVQTGCSSMKKDLGTAGVMCARDDADKTENGEPR